MGIVGINHIAFRTTDPARLSAFYARLLAGERLEGAHGPLPVGAWVSGSLASRNADAYSDIDVGVCFRDEPSRKAMWSHRWDWPIAPWFHRFDADHVRPFFVIYFFEPAVKADIALYVDDELPP